MISAYSESHLWIIIFPKSQCLGKDNDFSLISKVYQTHYKLSWMDYSIGRLRQDANFFSGSKK